ncbi:hypothetical protein THIOM_005218, partial [Candidatus Thiomargarita nelsonii]
ILIQCRHGDHTLQRTKEFHLSYHRSLETLLHDKFVVGDLSPILVAYSSALNLM